MAVETRKQILNELEWLAVDRYGCVVARICGLPMLAARQAVRSFLPELGYYDVAVVGKLSATKEQLAAAEGAPLITPTILAKVGITPVVKSHSPIIPKYRNTPAGQAERHAKDIHRWARELNARFPKVNASAGGGK